MRYPHICRDCPWRAGRSPRHSRGCRPAPPPAPRGPAPGHTQSDGQGTAVGVGGEGGGKGGVGGVGGLGGCSHLPADAPVEGVPRRGLQATVQHLVHRGGVRPAGGGDRFFLYGRVATCPPSPPCPGCRSGRRGRWWCWRSSGPAGSGQRACTQTNSISRLICLHFFFGFV